MRRARENEAIFSKQQAHLQGLFTQQKSRLSEARAELVAFQKQAAAEKQKQRASVERELSGLMRLKHEQRACYDWSEHTVRKKRFKLKAKVEEYWKRMDLYESLLLDLEAERSRAKQDTDHKLSQRIKEYERAQEEELRQLREQIAASEHDAETYTLQLDDSQSRLAEQRDSLHQLRVDYASRIGEAEQFCRDVKAQEESMLGACADDLQDVCRRMENVEATLHNYTIYKLHEGDDETKIVNEIGVEEESHRDKIEGENDIVCRVDNADENTSPSPSSSTVKDVKVAHCKMPVEENQRVELSVLRHEKKELEAAYAKKVEKYTAMHESARDALFDLQQDLSVDIERAETKLEEHASNIRFLEQRIQNEDESIGQMRSELRAREGPLRDASSSLLNGAASAFPEESEEDLVAKQQEIEQLHQSKEKIKSVLEATLQAEFSELNTGYLNFATESLSSSTSLISSVIKEEEGANRNPGRTDTNNTDSDRLSETLPLSPDSDGAHNSEPLEKKEVITSISNPLATTAVDKALKLVLHAGDSSVYMDSLVTKNNQYSQRRRVLGTIRKELQDLMRYQMTLHRGVAENFLTQKSLFEEVRSQERRDIHETIQTLILESEATGGGSSDEDMLLGHIVKESERIIEHQIRLDELEKE